MHIDDYFRLNNKKESCNHFDNIKLDYQQILETIILLIKLTINLDVPCPFFQIYIFVLFLICRKSFDLLMSIVRSKTMASKTSKMVGQQQEGIQGWSSMS